jgi:MarR family transcriptional regulator, organic hydroperoxide resistance regulator
MSDAPPERPRARSRARRPPGYPGHAAFLPYLLNRVTTRLNVEFQQELHRHLLTLTHWRVLAFLSERDGLPVTELAQFTATDQSTLSRALARMDRDGLITRRAGTRDSRVVQVFITGAGRDLFNTVLPQAMRLHRAAVRGLAPQQLELLAATLGRILVNLG